jgi:BON domain
VVAAPDEQAGQVADDALTERITQELQADPALHDSRIAVQSVHQGVVLLAGRAKTLSDHLHAVELVASVPGVQRVASEIQSPGTLADAEIWREPTPRCKRATMSWRRRCRRPSRPLPLKTSLWRCKTTWCG